MNAYELRLRRKASFFNHRVKRLEKLLTKCPVQRLEHLNNKLTEFQHKADYYNKKVDYVNEQGVVCKDLDVVLKLHAKLEELIREHDFMIKVNKVLKKINSANKQIDYLTANKFTLAQARLLVYPQHSYETIGFKSWRLKNNVSTIKSIEDRIKSMEVFAGLTGTNEQYDGFNIDYEEKRINFMFDFTPSADIKMVLKENGFKWSSCRQMWTRVLTKDALNKAKNVIQLISF